MIKKCQDSDFQEIYNIINDSSAAYKGVIPEDCWHEPYMSKEYLRSEIIRGVDFWGFYENDILIGVMGIQNVQDVTLIRHAYVKTEVRNSGIGKKLLEHLKKLAQYKILIGTWADAQWAIYFYKKNGFRLVSEDEKNRLLKKYWSINQRQIETSVVLEEIK